MIIEEEDYLAHIGTKRHSGRYPWGSGKNPEQRGRTFLGMVSDLKKQGLSDTEIVKALGLDGTPHLRALRTIHNTAVKAADIAQANKLRDKGMSHVAIGKAMIPPRNESSVRALLDPAAKDKNDQLNTTVELLRSKVSENSYLDVGFGSGNHINVSKEHLNTAVHILKEEGYKVQYYKERQVGTGKNTLYIALTLPTTTSKDFYHNARTNIKTLNVYKPENDEPYQEPTPPKSLSSRRVQIRYKEDGGDEMDGVIQLRRGVNDVSLGNAKYAQVRILVDKTHYLKGMAMYTDDLPAGVDVRFNTNKSKGGSKLDAMKPVNIDIETGKMDKEFPFGAVIKAGGQRGVLNIVNEEGDWGKWSKNLASQVLSKQPSTLAKAQLELKYKSKLDELDEIKRLTNPEVRKLLLEKFADDADSHSVHLKAAALSRQRTQAILPINSLKDGEVYAPNFRNGERVALVRFPHAGRFEIPELTVNNRNKEALSVLHQARDAIGINSRVASRLSGADFDGDTVLVIPNNHGKIKSKPALDALRNFDPKISYPPYDGMKTVAGGVWSAKLKEPVYPPGKTPNGTMQRKMGDISNLITDMTIMGGVNENHIARAVKHSMVVIDSEKHSLNVALSYKENGIGALKAIYQGGARFGAATLISQAKKDIRPNEFKPRPSNEGGAIDPATGKKMFVPTGRSYIDKDGKTKFNTTKTTMLANTDDAFTLVSKNGGTRIEHIYATHSNKLKALANDARLIAYNTKSHVYSESANKIYRDEVRSLNAKLNIAIRNKPLERNAQLVANAIIKQKIQANPHLDKGDIKKISNRALASSRTKLGAHKEKIQIFPNEWKAIQAGAISKSNLRSILLNAEDADIKKYATPRITKGISQAKKNHAMALLANGYTQEEVAAAIGVPLSALETAIYEGG